MYEGCMSKIFLEWDEPFWNEIPYSLTLAWTQEELEKEEDKDWAKGVYNFTSVDGHSNLLLCWVTGKYAKVADHSKDQEVLLTSDYLDDISFRIDFIQVLERLCHLIREFSGNPDIPMASAILRNAWLCDPFTLGTYCSPSPNMTEAELNLLSLPLPNKDNPRLCFAGEAAEPANWSYMQGARASGIREAERIIKIVK